MRKTITVKSGLVALATILAVSGCSGNKQETTTQAKVYVSEEQVETEVTTTTVTEDTTETTTAAETTQVVQNGDVDFSTYTKVDEIYNTNLEPNISDDISFEVTMTRNMDWNESGWSIETFTGELSTYSIVLDNNLSYGKLINEEGFELRPVFENYYLSINEKDVTYNRETPIDYMFEYNGIKHTINTVEDEKHVSLLLELSDKNGNIVTDETIGNYNNNELRVKAIGEDTNLSPVQMTFTVKNKMGDEVVIRTGDKYNDIKNQLSKLTEGADIFMHIDSNTKYLVLKNNNYTLFVERNVRDNIGSVIFINNNV